MAYILPADLKRLIQTDNLNQIIGNDDTILEYAISAAVIELKTYLVQKYIVTDEIKDFVTYVYLDEHYYGQRLILTAAAYDEGENYVLGNMCLYSGNVYRCLGNTSGPFNGVDWHLLGVNNAIYYVLLPPRYSASEYDSGTNYAVGDYAIYLGFVYLCTEATTGGFNAAKWQLIGADPIRYTPFNYLNNYVTGDGVYYKGRLYIARQNTPTLSSTEALQYNDYANLPNAPFPTNTSYWTDMGALVYANQSIDNTGVFAQGDNRNHQLVNICIDITLYHLHSRISPRNIPDLRVKRYDDALRWLRQISDGSLTADLPLIQPKSGNRIRWGGSIKQQNQY